MKGAREGEDMASIIVYISYLHVYLLSCNLINFALKQSSSLMV